MDPFQPHQTIEKYKSELVKKEEIIEKLFEEVHDLKEDRSKTVKNLENETKNLAQDNTKKDQEIKSLKASYSEALKKIKELEDLLQKNDKERIKHYDRLVDLNANVEKYL